LKNRRGKGREGRCTEEEGGASFEPPGDANDEAEAKGRSGEDRVPKASARLVSQHVPT
jgi:hypothetical protein